jgi:N6-L-threonylcarbamoyladenine synthase
LNEKYERSFYIGLDTSAYTTSLALVDQAEELLIDSRLTLPVKQGSLGLRQSEAVFHHINNLPRLWPVGAEILHGGVLRAIAAATQPRPVEGSYMPVFKVGEAFGLFLAQINSLNFLPLTHQEGHVMAGLWSAGLPAGRYLTLHLSGGTTEIIVSEEISPGKLNLNLLSGSSDLNAGQFIDRLGKAMGLGFPSGPQLEVLACNAESNLPLLTTAVCGSTVSFSGPASQAERLLQGGCSRPGLARAIEVCIADSLIAALKHELKKSSSYDGLLVVGGVASNQFIRQRLKDSVGELISLHFALPKYASDNAIGLAVQAARMTK